MVTHRTTQFRQLFGCIGRHMTVKVLCCSLNKTGTNAAAVLGSRCVCWRQRGHPCRRLWGRRACAPKSSQVQCPICPARGSVHGRVVCAVHPDRVCGHVPRVSFHKSTTLGVTCPAARHRHCRVGMAHHLGPNGAWPHASRSASMDNRGHVTGGRHGHHPRALRHVRCTVGSLLALAHCCSWAMPARSFRFLHLRFRLIAAVSGAT
jgi:hypothetical protein